MKLELLLRQSSSTVFQKKKNHQKKQQPINEPPTPQNPKEEFVICIDNVKINVKKSKECKDMLRVVCLVARLSQADEYIIKIAVPQLMNEMPY